MKKSLSVRVKDSNLERGLNFQQNKKNHGSS